MSIALSIGNNLTTGGVFTASAVNNTSVTNVTDFASVPAGGVLKLLSTQTASASASIEFTSGIDSTYDSYVFKFINIHPSTNNVDFTFNGSTDGGSNYNITKTTTWFEAYHDEADSFASLSYNANHDLAQSTSDQKLAVQVGSENDESASGTLSLFNPSSTTFVKHFISNVNEYQYNNLTVQCIVGGYLNSTSAVNAIRFKISSGTFDGTIKMYGVV